MRTLFRTALAAACAAVAMMCGCFPSGAADIHVSPLGDDSVSRPAATNPLRTISAAARLAQPGDTILVHSGVYRERIDPPRGGESESRRIVYRALPGEKVVIKGSEQVRGWRKLHNDTWKVVLPNTFFGAFNPYGDAIDGDWFEPKGRQHHTGAVYVDEHWLTEAATLAEVLGPSGETPLWHARVAGDQTAIWAQFKGIDPNEAAVEINVRQSIFYPSRTGINYITVDGFSMMHAATPWAPPTAEQVGLLGTNWSKGWIIQNNDIRYSVCTGITLGKYGDRWDNTSQNAAEGYVQTIERALENGWQRGNVGHHIVRNNHIAHCEQAGLVGSLGAIFSTITGNTIHDIHIRKLFTGAEMAGIKIHGAIDTEISGNRIYRTTLGIWLDWMAQGTRVTRNLMYQNAEDLFVEVNHGPFLIDSNLLLSSWSLRDMSEGGAYVHNLYAGGIGRAAELRRQTPYHKPHSTEVAGMVNIQGGDNRFFNNIFVGPAGLARYNDTALPNMTGGNVFLAGADPGATTQDFMMMNDHPSLVIREEPDGVFLDLVLEPGVIGEAQRQVVTSEVLGSAKISGARFVAPDGTAIRIDKDYLGAERPASPFPGPIEITRQGRQVLRVWPNH